jgi:hypothetical protein
VFSVNVYYLIGLSLALLLISLATYLSAHRALDGLTVLRGEDPLATMAACSSELREVLDGRRADDVDAIREVVRGLLLKLNDEGKVYPGEYRHRHMSGG